MPRNNHSSTTSRIKSLLERTEPLRVDQIADELGISCTQANNAVQLMITRVGGAVRAGRDGKFILYTAPGRAQKKTSSNVVGPRYLAPPGELRRNPFEHRDLALAGR